MTVDSGRIRCDAYGCRAEGMIDLPTLGLETNKVTPYDVRGWFAMQGWRIAVGPGGKNEALWITAQCTRGLSLPRGRGHP